MTKDDIIALIEKREGDIDKSIFNTTDKGFGSNQFRELAGICLQTDIYQEVELLIQYNISKDKPDNQNDYKSWSAAKDGHPSIGEIVIDCMNKIKDKSTEDDLMKNLSLFFGYMYWKARIWSSKNANETSVKQKRRPKNAVR